MSKTSENLQLYMKYNNIPEIKNRYVKGFTCLETETIAFCCKVNILEKTI